MSMNVSNDYGNYGVNSNTASKNASAEYYSYLQKNFDCVREGKVSISGKYLKQCANDPEKAKELEDTLAFYKESYEDGYKNTKAYVESLGGKINSYEETWSFDETGNLTMMVQVSATVGTDDKDKEEIRKAQEKKLKEKLEAKKREEERLAKKKELADTYEKSNGYEQKATYSVNKMSAEERANLVSQLKADQEARQQSLINLVQNTIGKQAKAFGIANDGDGMWKFIASGNYTVDAATQAQAKKDISEDGYWGVKQTSQRLFDFASALAGDDVDKMHEMQNAMAKGFRLATKAWGSKLPDISSATYDAANKLFEDYYASKK